jgi:hypothetical protein
MRREWSPLIKNRQWDELEKIAKKEPSQILCDTVTELEKGFTEKTDRRALRRILFLLRQAGYRAEEIDEEDTAPPELQVFSAGFLVSADVHGDTPITYALETKGRVRWLTAYVNDRKGIVGAGEETTAAGEAENKLARLRKGAFKPYVGAEIPAEYALSRIAAALAAHPTARVPAAIAYWRSQLDRAAPMEHPALSIPASTATSEERRAVVIDMDATIIWRLELGTATPVLKELYEAQQSRLELSEEQRTARVQAILSAARTDLFSLEVLCDHRIRLLDLAYVMHLKGQDAGRLVATVNDLDANGPESDYAKALLDKTMVMLVETMKASAEKRSDRTGG